MMKLAKRRKRMKQMEDSMDNTTKAEYDAAGPTKKAAMLEEMAQKLESQKEATKLAKRRKSSDDDDDECDDMGDDDGDGDDEDSDRDKRRAKARKMEMASVEDRLLKSEAELADIRKRDRTVYFQHMAERELPNTPGSVIEKGEMLQRIADTFGENSVSFKKMLDAQKSADQVLSERFSEIGKAARGDIPALAVFDAKVEEIAKRDKIDKPHAVAKAMEEAPELYLDYERSQRGIVARA
jgi:hypothetical protein